MAIVLGHSWGASVAVALALKEPKLVTRLILASGYYYPTFRGDVLLAWQAIPGIGDIISHTLSPILARVMWPALMNKILRPSVVPKKFAGFPKEMVSFVPRSSGPAPPSSGSMLPAAFALYKDYVVLTMLRRHRCRVGTTS